jgi:hypothetical protein
LFLGGGISVMTSGYPLLADIFFVVGFVLLIAKFWTWEEARSHNAWTVRIGTGIFVVLCSLAIIVNHWIKRDSARTTTLPSTFTASSIPSQTPTNEFPKEAKKVPQQATKEGKNRPVDEAVKPKIPDALPVEMTERVLADNYPLSTYWTFENTADVDIQHPSLSCVINLGVVENGRENGPILEHVIGQPRNLDFPHRAHDKEGQQCLLPILGTGPNERWRCIDLTVIYSGEIYGASRNHAFRRIGLLQPKGFMWLEKRVNDKKLYCGRAGEESK